MSLARYRQVLALPGVRSLLLLSLLGRVPLLGGGMVLTLHVVERLDRGFGAAGTVFAAAILGSAVGAPWLGRCTDRYGLRPVVVAGTVVSVGFWATAGLMSYPVLLVAGFVASLVQVPVVTLSRQGIAALVPEWQRRTAYSLDSTAVELAYMAGPSVGVLLATQFSTQAAIWAICAGMFGTGVAFYLLNPPLRSEAERSSAAAVRPSPRDWLRPGIWAALFTVGGATVVLGATEVTIVAALRQVGQLSWASVVLVAWGIYSMTGGLVYGGLRRAPGPIGLAALLGVSTTLMAFAGGWLWLAVALIPAGLLCAPTLAGATDAMSKLAPAEVRGEAMGWYGAALTSGLALGTPFAGVVIDLAGPAWGFVLAGGAGTLLAGVAALVARLDRTAPPDPAPAPDTAPGSASGPAAPDAAPTSDAAPAPDAAPGSVPGPAAAPAGQ